jgi:hypothetical protein
LPTIEKQSAARGATSTLQQPQYVALDDAQSGIANGDQLLFCRRNLISIAGRGDHSHAANAAWWDNDLYCLEVREWRGGRAATPESQVRRFPGRIDVYGMNANERWPEYDCNGRRAR